jgi:hypothetical protein
MFMTGLLVGAEKVKAIKFQCLTSERRVSQTLQGKLFLWILLVLLDTAEEKRGHRQRGKF